MKNTDKLKNFILKKLNKPYCFLKKHKPISILCASFLVVIISILSYFIGINVKYNKAEAFLGQNNYNGAIKLYTELKDYKDSPNKLLKAKYLMAGTLVDDNNFDKAITIYTELGNYEDCKDKIKNTTYLKAKFLIKNKDFKEAIKILKDLGNYRDSKDILKDADYSYAFDLFDTGEYLDAYKIFNSLGDYKSSESMLNECNYKQAALYRTSKDYESALDIYKKLGDYKDSETQITETLYQKALNDISAGNTATAYQSLKSLGDYKDTKKFLDKFVYKITAKEEIESYMDKPKKWIYHYNKDGSFSHMTEEGNPSNKRNGSDFDINGPKIETGTPGRHYTKSPKSTSLYNKDGYLTEYVLYNNDGSLYLWTKNEYSNNLLTKSETSGPNNSYGGHIINGHIESFYTYDSEGRILKNVTSGIDDNTHTKKIFSQDVYSYGYVYSE